MIQRGIRDRDLNRRRKSADLPRQVPPAPAQYGARFELIVDAGSVELTERLDRYLAGFGRICPFPGT